MRRRVTVRGARLICRLYPPSWRERYGEEYVSVLTEIDVSPRVVGDALVGAAGAVIFGQSTEDRPFDQANVVHPLAGVVYGIYEWCARLSVVAVLIAGLPLAASLVRAARGQRRARVIGLVLLPIIVPVGFLGVVVVIAHTVTRSRVPGVGVGPAWFGGVVVLGLVAAVACAAGPLVAMRRVWPSDRALRWALRASRPALALMGCSALASVAYELMLTPVAPSFAASFARPWWQITPYALVMGGACVVAITSLGRGVRPDGVPS